MRLPVPAFAIVAIALLIAASGAPAQSLPGADRLTPGAVAESLSVLDALEKAVRKDSKDAAAWHRRGMVAWALWERSRHQPPMRGLMWQRLTTLADTSLRLAAWLQPDSSRYLLAAMRFLVGSAAQFRRYGPYRIFGDAVERARESGDPDFLAEAAIEMARVSFLRYDQNYRCTTMVGAGGTTTPGVRRISWEFGREPTDYRGEIDYLATELLYREAYAATPDSARAFLGLARLLADRARWRELAALSRDQLQRGSNTAWAWLTMGIASYYLGAPIADAAFDSAFVHLDPAERQRMFRFDRALKLEDRAAFAALSDSGRKAEEERYWRERDKLWSVTGDEPRLEFFARVAYAELRWTSPELSINGVNTDQGYFHILAGVGVSESCKPRVMADYVWNDSTIHAVDPRDEPREVWTGLPTLRVYPLGVQVARFRAPRDSVDVMVASLPPYYAIQRSTDVAGPVIGYFWLYTDVTRPMKYDTVLAKIPAVHAFTSRVAPGTYGYRIEASAHAATMANSTTGSVLANNDPATGFMLRGFGLSDVVIAARADSRASAARRWNEFPITPLPGPIPRGLELSLLWETYELGSDAGHARFNASISIRRAKPEPSLAGRIAGSILGGIAGAIGIDRSDEHITFTFGRDLPYRAALVDHISLTLADTPAGEYVLTIEVHDLVSGRTTRRTQPLTIVERRPPPPVR